MSELLVNTIKKADGTGSLSVPAESGTVVTTASPSLGRRNLIINGAMQVAQRGTSNVNATGYKTVDRFELYEGSSPTYTFTSEQVSDAPDGFTKSFKVTADSAATFTGSQNFGLRYKLEGQDVQHLKYGTSSAQSVTISFWVKSSETGDFSLRVMNQSASGFRQYLTSYTINSANTWEYKTATITGDTVRALDDGNTAEYVISWELDTGADDLSSAFSWTTDGANKSVTTQVNLLAATNNTWQITGVQLEVGSVATPFEHRSYGEELALCQRYYYKRTVGTNSNTTYGVGVVNSSTQCERVFAMHPVEMRAQPTCAISSCRIYDAGVAATVTTLGTQRNSTSAMSQQFTASSGGLTVGRAALVIEDAGTGFLSMDAEL